MFERIKIRKELQWLQGKDKIRIPKFIETGQNSNVYNNRERLTMFEWVR